MKPNAIAPRKTNCYRWLMLSSVALTAAAAHRIPHEPLSSIANTFPAPISFVPSIPVAALVAAADNELRVAVHQCPRGRPWLGHSVLLLRKRLLSATTASNHPHSSSSAAA